MRELKKSTGMPRHIISVDLGGTSFKAGIVTEAGRVLCRAQAPTPAERKPAHVLAVLEKLILELKLLRPTRPVTRWESPSACPESSIGRTVTSSIASMCSAMTISECR